MTKRRRTIRLISGQHYIGLLKSDLIDLNLKEKDEVDISDICKLRKLAHRKATTRDKKFNDKIIEKSKTTSHNSHKTKNKQKNKGDIK